MAREMKDNTKMIKAILEEFSDYHYEDYIKAIISCETHCTDNTILSNVYKEYMEKKDMQLLNNEIIDKVLKLKEKKGVE
nr:MAG TPA: hypothetical protein [Caudoviricetes sp.]